MNKNTILIFVLLLFLSLQQQAQEIIPISKAAVLSKVLENNTSLKISGQEFLQAKADFRQTNAVLLPTLTASYTGISTTNPLMAFGSKLNQSILTAADFNPVLLNNPATTQNFATKIELLQPLINVDGFYQRKAAKSKMQATALQTTRAEEYLVLEVEKAYMQLQLAYKAVAVLEQALTTVEAHQKIAENSFVQGFLQKADILTVKIRVNEVKSELQNAKSSVQNASDYLSFLMNDETIVTYQATDELTEEPQDFINVVISEERADIKAMQLANTAYKDANKAAKMSFLPRLNAFGSYELHDAAIFKGSASGYVVGAQLSWTVFEGSKRFAKAQKSSAALEQASLEYAQYIAKSNLEAQKILRQLTDTKNKMVLTDLAVQQSEESLRIRKNRFKEGLEKTADLLAAETLFAEKQLLYYQTVFEYNYTVAYLQFLVAN